MEQARIIVDGTRAVLAFVVKMKAPVKAAIPMREMVEAEGGKIRSSAVFCDSKLFPSTRG